MKDKYNKTRTSITKTYDHKMGEMCNYNNDFSIKFYLYISFI